MFFQDEDAAAMGAAPAGDEEETAEGTEGAMGTEETTEEQA